MLKNYLLVFIIVILFSIISNIDTYGLDVAEERMDFMTDMNEPVEDMESIEDVLLDDDFSDAEITEILTVKKPAKPAKKETAKAQKPSKEAAKETAKEVAKPAQVASAPKTQTKKPVVSQPQEETAVAEKPQVQKKLSKEEKPIGLEAPSTTKMQEEPSKVAAVQKQAVKETSKLEEPEKTEAVSKISVKEEKPKVKEKVQVASVPGEDVKQEPVQQADVKRKTVTLKELKEKLGLTDKQIKRLQPIMKEKADKRREILKKYAGKGEAAKASMRKELQLFQKYYDDMYANQLTEEQYNKYLQLRKELMQKASS